MTEQLILPPRSRSPDTDTDKDHPKIKKRLPRRRAGLTIFNGPITQMSGFLHKGVFSSGVPLLSKVHLLGPGCVTKSLWQDPAF